MSDEELRLDFVTEAYVTGAQLLLPVFRTLHGTGVQWVIENECRSLDARSELHHIGRRVGETAETHDALVVPVVVAGQAPGALGFRREERVSP